MSLSRAIDLLVLHDRRVIAVVAAGFLSVLGAYLEPPPMERLRAERSYLGQRGKSAGTVPALPGGGRPHTSDPRTTGGEEGTWEVQISPLPSLFSSLTSSCTPHRRFMSGID